MGNKMTDLNLVSELSLHIIQPSSYLGFVYIKNWTDLQKLLYLLGLGLHIWRCQFPTKSQLELTKFFEQNDENITSTIRILFYRNYLARNKGK